MQTAFEHSAGGVVTTVEGTLVLIRAKNLKGESVIALPKGHVEAGEQPAAAARREVEEETGYQVGEPTRTLPSSQYWFVRSGTRIRKRVDWFCFTATDDPPGDHDPVEIDEVLVVDAETALTLLTYGGERDVVRMTLD